LGEMPGWMWLSELAGVGIAERNSIMPGMRPNRVTLNIDGALQVLRPRTVFRGSLPAAILILAFCGLIEAFGLRIGRNDGRR